MSNFSRNWEGNTGDSIVNRLMDTIRPQQPLKYKISSATKRIEAQIQVLESTISGMNQRDKFLFSKVVDAYSNHDIKRATMYANELAELRKTINLMLNAKLSLERVSLRLSTIAFVGNVAAAISPAVEILKDIRSNIAGVIPSAGQEIDAIITMLNEVMVESGQISGTGFGLDVTSEEAQKILEEAALIAEERAKEKFPELVASKPSEAERERFG